MVKAGSGDLVSGARDNLGGTQRTNRRRSGGRRRNWRRGRAGSRSRLQALLDAGPADETGAGKHMAPRRSSTALHWMGAFAEKDWWQHRGAVMVLASTAR
ncbi:basic proline-rich protein-like [Iris pallida]|uniref:Basic proline-rich protein-like n=1 Tax=Iris pallida TaxID=29817 RepID=A0AAX6GWS2_IRIPA|nr:basic proline-rich protein-like [Iris pallida]